MAAELVSNDALKRIFSDALAAGDTATVDAVRFASAGLLSEYIQQSHLVATPMVALMLNERSKPNGAFADTILRTLSEIGMIGSPDG